MFGNIEISGENNLYPKNRIPFIWKLHYILSFQLFLTIVVVSLVVSVPPVANFFNEQENFLNKVSLFAFFALFFCPKKHPLGYFFLLIFTVCLALVLGLYCAFVSGTVPGGKLLIKKVVTLSTALVISTSLHSFWATKRDCRFNSFDSIFVGVLLVLIFVGLIQILFPLEKLSYMIYVCLASTITYGLAVLITDHLIEQFSNGHYFWVLAALYLHVTNLFLLLLIVFLFLELINMGVSLINSIF